MRTGFSDGHSALFLIVSFYLFKSAYCDLCTWINCDPVEEFLANPAPQIIGPHCESCTECASLNFSTCTLVHPEIGSHCVCGNTVPSTCNTDHVMVPGLLERNATEFKYDYVCTFPLQGQYGSLPHLEVSSNEDGQMTVQFPMDSLNVRRYEDLQMRSISLYVLNETETERVTESHADLSSLEPYGKIHLDEEGSPQVLEDDIDQTQLNVTNWPVVTLPDVQPSSVASVAYSFNQPGHRLMVDPHSNTSVQLVPFSHSSITPVAPKKAHANGQANYTMVVLIIAGIILLIGLCCAAVSCMDKLRHNRHRKTVDNEIATSTDMETGKSASTSARAQSYTPIKNGKHENAHLLSSTERMAGDNSTLPMDSKKGSGKFPPSSTFRPQPYQPAAVPGDSSLGRHSPRSGSKHHLDISQRHPSTVISDRRKFLQLVKDANPINAADLDLLESIGTGEFGVIRRGYVFDRTEAMIHCLRPPHKQPSDSVAESLIERMDASVKAGFHPHIISLLGLCQEGDIAYVCLQMETGPNLRNMLRESRSLDQFLQYTNARGRLSLISPQRLLNIILGIARGMGHLEECQVLHDNLAAVNIVICDNGTPKIAGFGMATMSDLYMRQLEKNHDQLRWLPPETHDTGLFTMKSQTWSFGVVLWEIVAFGGTPYYNMSDDDVIKRVAQGHRLHRPSNCSRQLYDLMEQCWRANGDDRPDFVYVQQHVHELNLDPELHISVTYHDGFTYEPIKETWNT